MPDSDDVTRQQFDALFRDVNHDARVRGPETYSAHFSKDYVGADYPGGMSSQSVVG